MFSSLRKTDIASVAAEVQLKHGYEIIVSLIFASEIKILVKILVLGKKTTQRQASLLEFSPLCDSHDLQRSSVI